MYILDKPKTAKKQGKAGQEKKIKNTTAKLWNSLVNKISDDLYWHEHQSGLIIPLKCLLSDKSKFEK